MNYEKFPSLEYDENKFCFIPNAKCEFNELLHELWNKKMLDNCFRYKLEDLKTKYLPGKYRFVTQLNVKRAVERRKPHFISSIAMPFNPEIFHFGKVSNSEVLFTLKPKHWKENDVISDKEMCHHALIINVSPIEECHSLLVPNINKGLPQVLTLNTLRLAVESLLISGDKYLRIAFNSLGAYASVNHLHFHLYVLRHKLFLEDVSVSHLMENCYELLSYPAPGFAFQINKPDEVLDNIKSVMKLIDFLITKEIPHNLFLTKGKAFSANNLSENSNTIRIFVWARTASYGSKNDLSFNPACCELAGHIIVKENDGFEKITEEYVADILKSVCHPVFNTIKDEVKNLYT